MSIKNWYGSGKQQTLLETIRIGEKATGTRADGTTYTYPKALDHFVCPPEVLAATLALAEERGDTENLERAKAGKPRTLYVYLASGSIEDILPHAYKFYGKSAGLKCMGDGELVLRRDGDGESDPPGVRSGRSMADGKAVPCDRHTCPHAQTGKKMYKGEEMTIPAPCQARGYLHFLIEGVYRAGVYRLGMSKTAIRRALGQFEIARLINFGRIDRAPYLLHLTQKQEQTPNGIKNLWIPWLEVDPLYLEENAARVKSSMLTPLPTTRINKRYQLVDGITGELIDEDANGVPPLDGDEWLAAEEAAEEAAEKRTAAEAAAELYGDWDGAPLAAREDDPPARSEAESADELPAGDNESKPEPFANPAMAIAWGYEQGVFQAMPHAQNAYAALKTSKQPQTATEMAALWRADVAERLVAQVADGMRP